MKLTMKELEMVTGGVAYSLADGNGDDYIEPVDTRVQYIPPAFPRRKDESQDCM